MQYVILEILEDLVRRLGTFEIGFCMLQKYRPPKFDVVALQVAQSVESKLVMGSAGVGRVDHSKKQIHQTYARNIQKLAAKSESDNVKKNLCESVNFCEPTTNKLSTGVAYEPRLLVAVMPLAMYLQPNQLIGRLSSCFELGRIWWISCRSRSDRTGE